MKKAAEIVTLIGTALNLIVGILIIVEVGGDHSGGSSTAITITLAVIVVAFSVGIGIGTFLKGLTASCKNDMLALAILEILFCSRVGGILYLLTDDSHYGVPVVYDKQKKSKKSGNRYAYDGYEKHLPDDDTKD